MLCHGMFLNNVLTLLIMYCRINDEYLPPLSWCNFDDNTGNLSIDRSINLPANRQDVEVFICYIFDIYFYLHVHFIICRVAEVN